MEIITRQGFLFHALAWIGILVKHDIVSVDEIAQINTIVGLSFWKFLFHRSPVAVSSVTGL